MIHMARIQIPPITIHYVYVRDIYGDCRFIPSLQGLLTVVAGILLDEQLSHTVTRTVDTETIT